MSSPNYRPPPLRAVLISAILAECIRILTGGMPSVEMVAALCTATIALEIFYWMRDRGQI